MTGMIDQPVAMRCIDHLSVPLPNPQAPIVGWNRGGGGAGLGTGEWEEDG